MSKKMIEIPEDVAREFAFADHNRGTPLANAIRKALPPSRDERLGLPWSIPKSASWTWCVMDTGGTHRITANTRDQARLIAKAPEMAALLEDLLRAGYQPIHTEEAMQRVLREAGWLDE